MKPEDLEPDFEESLEPELEVDEISLEADDEIDAPRGDDELPKGRRVVYDATYLSEVQMYLGRLQILLDKLWPVDVFTEQRIVGGRMEEAGDLAISFRFREMYPVVVAPGFKPKRGMMLTHVDQQHCLLSKEEDPTVFLWCAKLPVREKRAKWRGIWIPQWKWFPVTSDLKRSEDGTYFIQERGMEFPPLIEEEEVREIWLITHILLKVYGVPPDEVPRLDKRTGEYLWGGAGGLDRVTRAHGALANKFAMRGQANEFGVIDYPRQRPTQVGTTHRGGHPVVIWSPEDRPDEGSLEDYGYVHFMTGVDVDEKGTVPDPGTMDPHSTPTLRFPILGPENDISRILGDLATKPKDFIFMEGERARSWKQAALPDEDGWTSVTFGQVRSAIGWTILNHRWCNVRITKVWADRFGTPRRLLGKWEDAQKYPNESVWLRRRGGPPVLLAPVMPDGRRFFYGIPSPVNVPSNTLAIMMAKRKGRPNMVFQLGYFDAYGRLKTAKTVPGWNWDTRGVDLWHVLFTIYLKKGEAKDYGLREWVDLIQVPIFNDTARWLWNETVRERRS